MTVLFGQPSGIAQAHEERKRVIATKLESLLALVAERGHTAMAEDTVTIVGHPNDLLVAKQPGSAIELLRFNTQSEMNDEVYDIVLYRLQIGRQAAFGLHNGAYIDPRKQEQVCITMRSIRFVEVMVPTMASEAEAVAGFALLDSFVALLETFFPPSAP